MQANPDDCTPFDRCAHQYDQWFDTQEGRPLWHAELACLHAIILPVRQPRDEWLEVGVGTGRFAAALGIGFGVDPSAEMLRFAKARGIVTTKGRGERLPYPAARFDGILIATTLCFVDDVPDTLAECHRVLRPDRPLCIGMLPRNGRWGRQYAAKGKKGHALYRHARFLTPDQVLAVAAHAGFALDTARSLLPTPAASPAANAPLVARIVPTADFVALRFRATHHHKGQPRH